MVDNFKFNNPLDKFVIIGELIQDGQWCILTPQSSSLNLVCDNQWYKSIKYIHSNLMKN